MKVEPLAMNRRIRVYWRALAALSALYAAAGCGGAPPSPEDTPMPVATIVEADRVITMLPLPAGALSPRAVVFRAGRIVFVGSREGALASAGEGAERVEFPGATIVPGLVDAHAHLTGLGKALAEVDLVGCRTAEEAVARVQATALPPGARGAPSDGYIEGRGWDQNDWPTREFPDHTLLTAAFPDRPVVLRRVDGHALWANAAALRLAGISGETRDPPGGRVMRDASGAPTGVFLDAAMALVTARMPEPTPGQTRAWLEAALGACHAVGLTGVHDAGATSAQVAVMEVMATEGALPLRVNVMLDADDPANEPRVAAGPKRGEYLSVTTIKLFADGALGSRGAWLSAPYSDAPDTQGIPIVHGDALRAQVARASAAGFQLAVHAIGDAAAHDVLEAFAGVLQPGEDRRFRLEHAQVVRPEDRKLMSRLGVIASMQPTHATSDMPWAERRLGPERIAWAYAWRGMLNDGVRLALGSDFPVERPAVLDGLAAAVTRQDPTGQPAGGWRPEERLTPLEALRGFTADAAFASFDERRRGQIAPGFDADLTVLRGNPLSTDGAGLRSLEVLATVVGGQWVHRVRP